MQIQNSWTNSLQDREYDTFINGGSDNKEEDENLGVMTRNKAKKNKEIKRIHYLQGEFEELKEENA